MDGRDQQQDEAQAARGAFAGWQPEPAQAGALKPPAPLGTMPQRPAINPLLPPQADHTPAEVPPNALDLNNTPPQSALQPIADRQAAAMAAPLPKEPTLTPEPLQARPAWQPAGLRPAQLHTPSAPRPVAAQPEPLPAQPRKGEPAVVQDAVPHAPQRRVLTQTLPQQSPHVKQYAQTYAPFAVDTTPRAAFIPERGGAPLPEPDSATGEHTRRRRTATYEQAAPVQASEYTAPQNTTQTAPVPLPAAARFQTPASGKPSMQAPRPLVARHTTPNDEATDPSATVYGQPPTFDAGMPAQSQAWESAAHSQATPYQTMDRQAASPWQGIQDALESIGAQNGLDDDSGQYATIAQTPLAEPMTVPTFDPYVPKRKTKKRGLWIAILTLLLLFAVIAALYFTGMLNGLISTLFPGSTGSTVPSIFGSAPNGVTADEAGVQPATQVVAPRLDSITVSPAEATAPATIAATLTTNAATTAIRLFREDNSLIYTVAYASAKGDGFLWNVDVTFDTPYTGKVLVYLRDANGLWSIGDAEASVTIQ